MSHTIFIYLANILKNALHNQNSHIMKPKLLYLFLFVFVAACSNVKKANNAAASGDYKKAIELSVNRLQKNKNKKADKEHVEILENAFAKMKTATLERINFLRKDTNVNTQEIYNLYLKLDNVQKNISPLLPLYKANGQAANFVLEDYSDEIIQAKQDYANSIYQEGKNLLNGNKTEIRKAYSSFEKLLKMYPNYKDAKQLMQEAHDRGTDYVFVIIQNNTQQIIPVQLENALLDFNTYGLDTFWTVYHASRDRKIKYDYEVVLDFQEILISPERIAEKQIPLEKEIVEVTYKKDRHGNNLLDDRGNPIKEEIRRVVKGTLKEVVQTKSLAVSGQVYYYDVNKNQKINSYPLQSEFVFQNVFGEFKGDDRVLTNDQLAMIKNRFVPFPPTEQMLLDASTDIKSRFGAILKRNKF